MPGGPCDELGPCDNDPFFAPSCARGGGEITHPTKFKYLKVWIHAFIPKEIPGETEPVPGFPGKTMIRVHVPLSGIRCFATDQRFFDPFIHASYRMHSEIQIDVTKVQTVMEWHDTGCTYEFDCDTGRVKCKDRASKENMHFTNPSGASGLIEFSISAEAHNPCVTLSAICGDIDYRGNFTLDVQNRQLTFSGLRDPFPAFEMYASADYGPVQTLDMRLPDEGAAAPSVCGEPRRPFGGSVHFP
jgi:hypothetical protein